MADLPVHTKQTNRISDASLEVRNAITTATSPEELLCVTLPTACGYAKINQNSFREKTHYGFFIKLRFALDELRDCYPKMINKVLEELSLRLLPDNDVPLIVPELRKKLIDRYRGVEEIVNNSPQLFSFATFLLEEDTPEEVWINRLFLFIGDRPPYKWTDHTLDSAITTLTGLASQLIDTCAFNLFSREKITFSDGYDILRIRAQRLGHYEYDELVEFTNETKKKIASEKIDMFRLLSELEDDESRAFMLSELIHDTLSVKTA